MRQTRLIFTLIVFLISFPCLSFAAEVNREWNKTVTQDGSADTYSAYYDADGDGDEAGEEEAYRVWTICNWDSTDVVYFSGLKDATGTLIAAVAGTKSSSKPIRAGTCRTFQFQTGISTFSMICSSSSCTPVDITGSTTK